MIRELLYRILCRLAPNEVRARIAAIRNTEGLVSLLIAAAKRAEVTDLVLAQLLHPSEREVLALLRQPDRWRGGEAELSPEEIKALCGFLASPLGQKLNQIMQDATVQQSQRATLAQPAQLEYAAGFAAGFRACWAVFVKISATAGEQAEPKDDPVMQEAGLEHITTA